MIDIFHLMYSLQNVSVLWNTISFHWLNIFLCVVIPTLFIYVSIDIWIVSTFWQLQAILLQINVITNKYPRIIFSKRIINCLNIFERKYLCVLFFLLDTLLGWKSWVSCDFLYPFPMHLVSHGKFRVKFSLVICQYSKWSFCDRCAWTL